MEAAQAKCSQIVKQALHPTSTWEAVKYAAQREWASYESSIATCTSLSPTNTDVTLSAYIQPQDGDRNLNSCIPTKPDAEYKSSITEKRHHPGILTPMSPHHHSYTSLYGAYNASAKQPHAAI
jgi:hypothetical protein